MNESALALVRKATRELFRGTRVFLAYGYGSRIRGSPRADSDLDIGYYLARPGDSAIPIAEEMHLADALSIRLGFAVDLRNLAGAPLELRGRVLEEGLRLYCSDDVARVNLERDLLGEYHDYKEEFEALRLLRLNSLAQPG